MARSCSASVVVISVLLLMALFAQPSSAHGPESKADSDERQIAEVPATIWGCPMCETVRSPEPGQCSICRMDLVKMGASTAAGNQGVPSDLGSYGSRGSEAPLMPGVPLGLFLGAAGAILVLSFLFLQLWDPTGHNPSSRHRRADLFRIPGLKWLLKQRWFVPALQLPVIGLFGLVVIAGLFGNQDPGRNIAPVVTWTLWWTWLVLVILFLGKIWCTVCPWMAIADQIAKLGSLRRNRRPWGQDRRWPRRLRNIWLATFLFLGLTWFELGFGVTEKPWLTALLGLLMVAVSVGTILIYERKAFCRYACLVGRVSGLYSMFAASELRSADRNTCKTCATKDCYHGNEQVVACPTHQFIGAMDANTYCTLCFACVQSCPEDNIAWNVRPPGADLTESPKIRIDEAYLAVILLSMSAFHGLSMTPTWDRFVNWIQNATGLGTLAAFSTGMTVMILLPLLIYYGVCETMRWFARDRDNTTRQLFIRFSYSLIPIALFYHLAHNLQHIFYEGKKLVRAASDPFGWGWDLFGTAQMPIDAWLPIHIGWGMQLSLIVIGHVFGILIAHQIATALYANKRQATLSQIPMLAAMLLFSFQSLWLLAQPMLMRTAM